MKTQTTEKQRIVSQVRRRRAIGETWDQVGAAYPYSVRTLRRWVADAPAPSTKKVQVERLVANTGGLKTLGHTVWWTIRNQAFPEDDFRAIVTETLGEEFVPRTPAKKRALRLALETMEQAGIIRKVRDDADMVAYALVEEKINAKDVDIDWEKKSIVIWSKKTDSLTFRGDFRNDRISQLFEGYQNLYLDSDVRGVVLNYVRANSGISLRDTGGIYFLAGDETLRSLDRFFEQVDGVLYSLPIFDVAAARSQLSGLAREELQRDISVAASAVEEVVASGASDTVLHRRIETFKKLTQKASLYKDIFGLKLEEFNTSLEKSRTQVKNLLLEGAKQYSFASKFPYRGRVVYRGGRGKKLQNVPIGTEGTVVGYCTEESLNWEGLKILFDTVPNKISYTSIKCVELV